MTGCPDLILCVRGFFLAMEVKAEGGQLTEMQQLQAKKIRTANGTSVLVRSVDDAIEAIEGVLVNV